MSEAGETVVPGFVLGGGADPVAAYRALERRRLELWFVAMVVLVAASIGVVVTSLNVELGEPGLLPPRLLPGAFAALSVLFCVYATEKELQFRRLGRRLADEAGRSQHLRRRLDETQALVAAGKALNDARGVDAVVDVATALARRLAGDAEARVRVVGDAEATAPPAPPALPPGRPGRGLHHDLLVPLVVGEELVGSLEAHVDGQAAHVDALHALGEMVAGAISRERLLDESLARAEELARLAFYDPLTELPNRRLLSTLGDKALARARRTGATVALLFVDLDNFKQVNEEGGHHAGDELLVRVAEELRVHARAGESVARLAGDEFAVLLEDLPDADFAVQVAQRFLHALDLRSAGLGGAASRVGASIGVAVALPGQSFDQLLRESDAAMYRAKRAGKGRVGVAERDHGLVAQEG